MVVCNVADGSVVTDEARGKVESDPTGFPWPPKALETLDDGLGAINKGKLCFLLGDTLEVDAAGFVECKEAFETIAKDNFKSAAAPKEADECAAEGEVCSSGGAGGGEEEKETIMFTFTTPQDAQAGRVKEFLGLGAGAKDQFRVVVADIPSKKKWVMPYGGQAPTKEEVLAFLEKVRQGEGAVGLQEAVSE